MIIRINRTPNRGVKVYRDDVEVEDKLVTINKDGNIGQLTVSMQDISEEVGACLLMHAERWEVRLEVPTAHEQRVEAVTQPPPVPVPSEPAP